MTLVQLVRTRQAISVAKSPGRSKIRSLDVIGVIDRETGQIIWVWGPDVLDGQHKPHMLANGNILIFDNGTWNPESHRSVIIEINPYVIGDAGVPDPVTGFVCTRTMGSNHSRCHGSPSIRQGALA